MIAGDSDTPTVTIADALRSGALQLQGIADRPLPEARLLLAHALGLTRNDLIRDPGRLINPRDYLALVARRQAHEPLAYITGHREFWSLDFLVSPATLIPRADSETVVEAAVGAFVGRAPPARILDLGTGTGCLLLAVLHECPGAFGIGVDLAPAAAELARTNAVRLKLAHRSAFIAGNWMDAIGGRFDLILSNPPYIAGNAISALMPDVAEHEPRQALDGGADGLRAYRAILRQLPDRMAPGGIAVLELGAGQSDVVAGMAGMAGLKVSLRLDLAQIPRALVLQRPNG